MIIIPDDHETPVSAGHGNEPRSHTPQAADDGLRISVYTAEPGTPSHDALNLLASWAATLDQVEDPAQPASPDQRWHA